MARVVVIDEQVQALLDDTLPVMAEIDRTEFHCRNCGTPVAFPLQVSNHAAKDLELLLKVARQVMDEHGITAHLLADIRTKAIIAKLEQDTRNSIARDIHERRRQDGEQ